MRRLYFLVPDLKSASAIVDELLLARIPEKHIHAIARPDTDMGDLPAAGLAEKSDLIPALERGLGLGGVAGTLAGLVAVSVPDFAVLSASSLMVGLALAGSTLGAWISTMIGVSVDSPRLQPFQQAIAGGQILMLVDVPKSQVDTISQRIVALHPQAHLEGVEPNIPAFP